MNLTGGKFGGPNTNIQGLEPFLANLNKKIEEIKGASLAGLIRCARIINEETLRGDVTTPVDLGNLRHSWFVVTSKGAIQAGGGKSHTPDGATPGFTGPKAAEFAASHSDMLKEMQSEANIKSKESNGPFLIMGYSVNYAVYVHEVIGKHHKRPTGAKWFQAALYKHEGKILKTIKENVQKALR
jgi:hypothetical protein